MHIVRAGKWQPPVAGQCTLQVVLHISPALQCLAGLITINMSGLRCSPTGRKEHTLASLAAKAYAETSNLLRATRLIHQPAAGGPTVSRLCAGRLHAGERYAVSAGTVSGDIPGADSCASRAPPLGNAQSFRELPVRHCSRRRSDCAHRRLCAARARRFSAPCCVRTAVLQRTAPTRSSASRPPVSRLN